MQLKIKIIFIILISFFVFLVCNKLLQTNTTVTTVLRGTAINGVSGNAIVVPAMTWYVKAQENGFVINSISPKENGILKVKKGEWICKLDSINIELELENARHQINNTYQQIKNGSPIGSSFKNSKEDLMHMRKLAIIRQYPEELIKKQEREVKRLSIALKEHNMSISNQYSINKKILQQLEFRKKNCTIYSPENGLLAECHAIIGDYIYAGSIVAKIISAKKIIEVNISEEDYPGIDLGQFVSINFLGYPGIVYKGKIVTLLATANSISKRRSVYVELENEPKDLTAGMTGEASILKAERKNAIIIPRRALLGNSVLLVEKGKVYLRPVEVGFKGLLEVEILSGLKEKDLIIVEDIQAFRNGDKVKTKINPQ